MAITSLNDYIGANKQRIHYRKTANVTSVALTDYSVLHAAGNNSLALASAGGNNTSGIVPVSTNTGYPTFNTYQLGAKGYLTNIQFTNSVASRLYLCDRLFSAGSYTFNTTTSLVDQPSFAGRVNSNFTGCNIFIEMITAFVGASTSVTVTYTNQDGVAGRSTGTVTVGALGIGRMLMLPLAIGDTGVQQIESVTTALATAGTFNICVLKEIWLGRVPFAGFADVHDLSKTGMPEIHQDTAFQIVVNADSTVTGLVDLLIEIANN